MTGDEWKTLTEVIIGVVILAQVIVLSKYINSCRNEEDYDFEGGSPRKNKGTSDAIKGGLIQHLSKEIETHTNAMMEFRNKASLAVFLGPYAILGSYLFVTQGKMPAGDMTAIKIGIGIILLLFYLGMGFCAYRIEFHIWDQCNQWRREICYIGGGIIPKDQFIFKYIKGKSIGAYLIPYALMGIAFLTTLYLLMSIPQTR